MSCFDVQILDPNINTIEIETCIGDQPSSIDIVTYDNTNTIEINHCIALLPSEINDLITVKDILAGSGISVSDSSGIYTISLSNPTIYTSGIIDFLEGVQDIIGNSGLVGGNYININYNDTTGFTTISTTGLQPSGNYSIVGHSHTSSDITNFNSSVSGLLPVKNISAGSGIGVSSVSGDFTVSVTGTFGLTSEEVDDRVSNLLVAGNYINLNYNDLANTLTISATGLQPSGNYSVIGHTHSASNITDFNSGVSGLLPSVTGSSYINATFNNNIYTIGATGLQPSGNYSVVGHTHTSSEITDFSSAVSGLIPLSNFTSLSGVSGVVVTNSGTNYYVGLSDPTIQLADITDLSSNARTFLLTPSSNNLSSLISDETGSGVLVFNNSPAFSGTPTVPTAPSGTNNTQIASTAFVRTEISNLVDSAPSTLDTLNELAAALGDDPNFATTVTNSLAGKANLSGAIFTGGVTIPYGTGNFNSLTVNSTGVSLVGHTHVYTDITNFASGVDAALGTALVAGTGIYLYENSVANTLTISTTGVSMVGHSHTSSSITDFNSSVSGLLPVKNILGNGYIGVSSSSGIYTISATGLQPSGNYSLVGHTHSSSDITNFNSGVSGLLPVTNIVAGSNVTISTSGTVFTIAASGGGSTISNEDIDDRVSSLLVAGTGIVLNYDDNANTLTIASTGLQPSGNYSLVGHSHISSDITDFNSAVSGLLPVKNLIAGAGIAVSNASGIYTIDATGSGVLANQAASLVTTVFNKTGSPIPKMTAVYINGGQGDLPTVSLAIATGDTTSAGTYGLTYETINNMSSGKAIVFGALTGLDTDQFNPTAPMGNVNGSVLYLSPSISGALTTTKPSAPNHIVAIGTIVRTHQNEGVIEVRVQNGFELEELHNVAISGVTNGQFLQYNSGTQLWIPTSSGNFTTLQVNGTGVVSSSGGSNGYLSKFTASNTINNSIIYQSGNNIGIGTNNPQYILDIAGSGNFNNILISGVLLNEFIDDEVAGLLVAGSGITLNYDDNLNTLSLDTTANTILAAGTGIAFDYNGITDTLSINTNLISSNISNFNSSVSGLLPVTNILAGSNISVSSSGSVFTIESTFIGSGGTITSEDIDDRVAALLVASTGIIINYNDGGNTLSIATSGNYALVGHTHTSIDITDRNKTLALFTALDNQPPASGFATLDTRNSIAILDFSDTTEESSVFIGVIPDNTLLASGILVRINWMATTATTGDCRWGVQFEKMNSDTDSDSFDTATEGQSTTNVTAGIPTVTSITCASIDSLAAGDFFRLKIYRDAGDTVNDTMTDDAELISVELRSVL